MFKLTDYPLLVLVGTSLAFLVSAWLGRWLHVCNANDTEDHDDFSFVLGATLTLLGLMIALTFSMAVNRYDQRKNYEEQEANAIGTEYVRADLVPTTEATEVRALLKAYLDVRILCYTSHDERLSRQLNDLVAHLQSEMWSAVVPSDQSQPTPVTALFVSGMNDVLNSQGYAQASWWNRIPSAAWYLLIAIGIFCNFLIGYFVHKRDAFLFSILPVALSISLFLIAEIDSPHHGLIRVQPQNLEALSASLHSH